MSRHCSTGLALVRVGRLSLHRKEDVCSPSLPLAARRMLLPARLSWEGGRNLCRRCPTTVTVLETSSRFGGRLQLDRSVEDVRTTFAMISAGEILRPSRCERVWLGASDLQEEVGEMVHGEEGGATFSQGVWRDSETEEVVDMSRFWGPGQV